MVDMTKQASTGQLTLSRLAWFREIGNAVVDLFFPPSCVSCHRLGAWLCKDCLDEIEVIQPPVCFRCGLPLEGQKATAISRSTEAQHVCPRCRGRQSQLDGLYAYGFHAGPLRQAIHQLKYEGLRALATPLGRLMAQGWPRVQASNADIDVIVPVPLHRSRQRKRGYNQSALLARQLGSEIRRPVLENVLIRVKATTPQVDLNAEERQANVRNAFQTTDSSLAGKHVLLVDDVCTTGSTLEAAGHALRAAQASSVWAYTLARARNLAQM
jgi:ComF family protein